MNYGYIWVRVGTLTPMVIPAPQLEPGRGTAPQWTLGDRLRKVRRHVVKTEQREFASLLGVSKETYTAWETDRNMPKDVVAIARRIELLTGVPAAWMLGVDVPAQATGQDQDTMNPTVNSTPR